MGADGADFDISRRVQAHAGHGDKISRLAYPDEFPELSCAHAKWTRFGELRKSEHLGGIRGAKRHKSIIGSGSGQDAFVDHLRKVVVVDEFPSRGNLRDLVEEERGRLARSLQLGERGESFFVRFGKGTESCDGDWEAARSAGDLGKIRLWAGERVPNDSVEWMHAMNLA